MILTDLGAAEIGGIASGGSIFLMLVSLLIRVILKRMEKLKRYEKAREGLRMIKENIDEENQGGRDRAKRILENIRNGLEEIKGII